MAKKRGKIGVTNEKIMEILSGMKEKVDNTDSLMEIQSRHSGRLEKEMSSIGSRVKRFETVVEKSMSALEERMNEIEGAIKTVVEWGAMKSDLQDFATRNDIERMKGEIIEPIIKAVDKDAETVINHGRRITVLERRAGIAAK